MCHAKLRRNGQGWVFDADGVFSDTPYGLAALHELAARAPRNRRVTVSVMWDKITGRAVPNESADIGRMLTDALGGLVLAPTDLRDEIAAWTARKYAPVNTGVDRAGFARSQNAHDRVVAEVFAVSDAIEARLMTQRYCCGTRVTGARLRLFPTLARFDVAYHFPVKCNIGGLSDCPNLWAYAHQIHQMPGIADTVTFEIYQRGYFSASEARNPLGIVPAGPIIDWTAPHGRG